MEEFFRRPHKTRAQQRFEFDTHSLWEPKGQVRMALMELFNDKCAYCESPVTGSGGRSPNLEHFRPKANARNVDGSIAPDHYWWLFYEWKNLYVACQECNTNKRDQFPVVRARAPVGLSGDDLRGEEPLLLDPCFDDPAEHLRFEPTGRVKARSSGRQYLSRAQLTISILGLNRDHLVKVRRQVANDTLNALRIGGEAALRDIQRPGAPYSAVRRTVLELFSSAGASSAPLLPGFRPAAVLAADAPPAEEDAPPLSPANLRIAYVTRVEIQNFRAIRALSLDLHPEGTISGVSPAAESESSAGFTDRIGWKVLLGENGSGKSSVVQAICLALAGEANARRWIRRGRELLRRPAEGERAPRSGFVRLHLNRGEVIEFQITGGKVQFTRGAEGAGTFLRAYGATRLLPSPRKRKIAEPRVVQIENLFDPFVPLHHASRWLAGLPRDRFDKAARTLKDLLRIPPDRDLTRDAKGNVLVPDASGAPMPLHHLSDGYQTVIALAVDIMAGLPAEEVDYQRSPGIVLLDELGTHLHPRWRMVIVESLRNAFSSMQFIATTHEPLCLRGLREGEIAVMRRDGDDIGVLTDLPSPEKLRIDQLLTSPFFGLHTTIDPDIDRRFQEYYDLLAMPDLAPELEQRRDALRDELAGFGVLGYTRRDQLMYEVVDRYLAKAQKQGRSITTLPLGAKKELLRIWKRVGALREAER